MLTSFILYIIVIDIIAILFFKIFFKKTIVKKGQTCYNLFKVKKGQR